MQGAFISTYKNRSIFKAVHGMFRFNSHFVISNFLIWHWLYVLCYSTPPSTPIPKIASAHTRLIFICKYIGMKKTTQKNSDTEQNAFRYRCYALYSIFGVCLENDAEKHFMLRKWQHEQVAPLAIQTPSFGGLCIGCAVLPAQRGHPLRDLPDATIRSGNDETAF